MEREWREDGRVSKWSLLSSARSLWRGCWVLCSWKWPRSASGGCGCLCVSCIPLGWSLGLLCFRPCLNHLPAPLHTHECPYEPPQRKRTGPGTFTAYARAAEWEKRTGKERTSLWSSIVAESPISRSIVVGAFVRWGQSVCVATAKTYCNESRHTVFTFVHSARYTRDSQASECVCKSIIIDEYQTWHTHERKNKLSHKNTNIAGCNQAEETTNAETPNSPLGRRSGKSSNEVMQ
jgi:hypothetical protein